MSTNIMEDRLNQMIGKLQEELNGIEERRSDLKRQIGMLEFIRSGSDEAAQDLVRAIATGKRTLSASAREKMSKAQKERHAKGKNNAMNARWTDQDDKVIVGLIKSKGKIAGPEATRLLLPKFGNARTEGAIRQRIARLAESGVLKQSMNGKDGGVPHMMVEAS